MGILKGENTKTKDNDILAVRFDKKISSHFKKMLDKAAKLKKKYEAKQRHLNQAHAQPPNPGQPQHRRRRRRNVGNIANQNDDNVNMSQSEIFKAIYYISWNCPLCKFKNKKGSNKC